MSDNIKITDTPDGGCLSGWLKGGESTMTNDKTAEKLLREQLALLAERSKDCLDELLPSITAAMVEIYKLLKP